MSGIHLCGFEMAMQLTVADWLFTEMLGTSFDFTLSGHWQLNLSWTAYMK